MKNNAWRYLGRRHVEPDLACYSLLDTNLISAASWMVSASLSKNIHITTLAGFQRLAAPLIQPLCLRLWFPSSAMRVKDGTGTSDGRFVVLALPNIKRLSWSCLPVAVVMEEPSRWNTSFFTLIQDIH